MARNRETVLEFSVGPSQYALPIIETEHNGPTRVTAFVQGASEEARVSVARAETDTTEMLWHARAAATLMQKFGWTDRMAIGARGHAGYVFTPSQSAILSVRVVGRAKPNRR